MKIIHLISVAAMLLLLSACSYDTPQIESEVDAIEIQIQESLSEFSTILESNPNAMMMLNLDNETLHSKIKTSKEDRFFQKTDPDRRLVCMGHLNRTWGECLRKELETYGCADILKCGQGYYCVYRGCADE